MGEGLFKIHSLSEFLLTKSNGLLCFNLFGTLEAKGQYYAFVEIVYSPDIALW